MPGPVTSDVEVTNISRHGIWLLLDDRELFLPFEQFPWFEQATVGADSQGREASTRPSLLAATGCRPLRELHRAPGEVPLEVEGRRRRDVEGASGA